MVAAGSRSIAAPDVDWEMDPAWKILSIQLGARSGQRHLEDVKHLTTNARNHDPSDFFGRLQTFFCASVCITHSVVVRGTLRSKKPRYALDSAANDLYQAPSPG